MPRKSAMAAFHSATGSSGSGSRHRIHPMSTTGGMSYVGPMPRPKYHTDAEHVAAESAVLAASAEEMRATSDS